MSKKHCDQTRYGNPHCPCGSDQCTPASEGKASTPWIIVDRGNNWYQVGSKPSPSNDDTVKLGELGCEVYGEANAEFICLAVNNHAKLIEALEIEHKDYLFDYKDKARSHYESECVVCHLIKQSRSGEGR